MHWCQAGQQQAHRSPSGKSDTKSVNVFPLKIVVLACDTSESLENMEHAWVPSRKVETNSDTAGALFYTPFPIKYAPLLH